MSILSNRQALKNAIIEIPLEDERYPTAWKEMANPPSCVYAIGNVSLLRERKLTVVGSRRTPTAVMKIGMELCKELSRHFTIVTGTADGGDSAAIEGALGSGKVICVLAGGFSSLPQGNLPLLERVAERGLLLSPCPFETPTMAYSYEYRNKLLAKLSEGTLVLSAGEKSGALITAKYAKAYKKPIFAFPYPPNVASGVGCNRLIKEGAYLTESAGDIAEKYGVNLTENEVKIPLSPDEERVYSLLEKGFPMHANEIAAKTGFPVFRLRGLLSALEIKGLILPTGGNTYVSV